MKTFIISLLCIFCLTTSNFAQWTEQSSGISTQLYSVSAVDNKIVWACGEGGVVLRTINAGLNWTPVTSVGASIDLYTVKGIDDTIALVGGANTTAGVAYKTTDGGVTWVQTFSQPGGRINSVTKFNGFPVCGLFGDPVDDRWTQFISFDFGSTWDSTGYFNSAPAGEVGWNNSFFQAFPSGFFSYYGTNNTKVYQFIANGSIQSYPTPGLQNSMSIWGNSNERLMTGGETLLYTTDGGLNWTNVNAIGTGNILGITGRDFRWYYVRGSSVYKSTNDGGSWSNDHTATGTYSHISLSPQGWFMWAVRDNGGISRYEFFIPLPVELLSFNPEKFSLSQNYPNPFNPSTKIYYYLPFGANVSLKVFDMTGREVITLVNEFNTAGYYVADFNASNLSTGVYLYRMSADANGQSFTSEKRMVLVK